MNFYVPLCLPIMGSFHSRGGPGGGPVLLTGMGPTTGVIRLICEPNPTLEVRGKRLSPKAKNSEMREKKKTPETKRQDRYVKGNHTTTTVVVSTDNHHGNSHRTTTKTGQQHRHAHNGAARLTSQARRRTSKNSEDDGRHNDDDDDNNEGASSTASKSSRVNLNELNNLPAIDSPEAINVSAIRMKYMMKKLKRDAISKTDVIRNIQYVVSVLEKVYDNEKRRLLEEEQELNDVVETDSVSGVIKEWLTSTFTRSLSNMARKPDDRVIKFRSVANAIRAGIVVDRIYRRMSSSAGLHVPPNVLLQMKNLDLWSFDVFQVNDIGENHALKYVGYEVLVKYDLIRKFKINSLSLDNFLLKLESGYSKHNNPYHNLVHAADVTQTMHSIITDSKLSYWLSDMELFATIIASLVHDYEHTGTTNAFHINTGSDFALLYNDKAVLENHHASSAFKLLKDENLNILSNLSREQHKEFRALVIEIVLSTDMSFHFQQIKNMKNLLSLSDPIDKTKALSLIVHCADISHPAKEWRLHLQWTNKLIEEFFRQGDKESELGLPISPLCDRKSTNISESQIGFIDFIVDPSFQVMADMLDKLSAPIKEQHQADDMRAKAAAAKAEEEKKAAKEAKAKTASSGLSSASSCSSTSSLEDQQDTTEVKMSQIWANCFSSNKQRWRDRAERETQQKAAEKKAEPDGEDKGVVAADEAESETTKQQQNNETNIRQDIVTVTSIQVKSAPDEDSTKRTKSDKAEEDGYTSDLTDSDDLAISSASSVVDEAEPKDQ